MTQDAPENSEATPSSLPFPSRREVHGSRIPKVPGDVPPPPKIQVDFPSRTQVHGTGAIPQVDGGEVPTSSRPEPDSPRRKVPEGAPSPASPGGWPSRQTKKAVPSSGPQTRKWLTAGLIVALVAIVGLAGYLALSAISSPEKEEEVQLDYPGPGHGQATIVVKPGDNGSDIGQALVDADVVKTVEGFKLAFDNNTAAATIQPGTYTLKKQMTSAGALAMFLDEVNRQDNAVTVVPGHTQTQVAEKLVQVGGFTPEQVEDAFADAEQLGLPEAAEGSVEGWLRPGTYEIGDESSVEEVVEEMIAATVEELNALDVPVDEWQTVLTKASILEREVSIASDLPLVARVIENRLDEDNSETRGLLQMDSTVLYGVGRTSGLPTQEELADDNPYNTYLKPGLPPTPIGNPSLEAVQAILEPADGDWLYFVTVDLDTGETIFSSTLDEHSKNIQLLDEWCAENKPKCD